MGLSLYAKCLERGRFIWPSTVGGVVHLSGGQMSYLLEGIDWRNPQDEQVGEHVDDVDSLEPAADPDGDTRR